MARSGGEEVVAADEEREAKFASDKSDSFFKMNALASSQEGKYVTRRLDVVSQSEEDDRKGIDVEE